MLAEYNRQLAARARAVATNRVRRMSTGSLPPVAVPPKPAHPTVPVAYTPEGDYIGRLASEDEAPEGAVIRWEPAKW